MERIALSVKEMAQTLGICRATAYKLINEPGFPVAKIGDRIIIPVAGLNAWLANGGSTQRQNEEGETA